MIDPPSGWRYGFPKEMPEDLKPEDINEWLVLNGYPKEMIDDLGEYFHYRVFEIPEIEITPEKIKSVKWDNFRHIKQLQQQQERAKLKSLEQHNAEKIESMPRWGMNKQKNGIACPTCGEELYDSNPMVTLTSFPAQKNIHCEKCNYSGYRIA